MRPAPGNVIQFPDAPSVYVGDHISIVAHYLLYKRAEVTVRAENLVLLVESDVCLRRSLEKFLGQAGYAFQSGSTAAQALALAQVRTPSVVIAEYRLPDANAGVLIEKLTPIAPQARVILLSEYDFQAIAGNLCRVEIATFLKKPFDLVDLENSLSSAFEKWKSLNPDG